jgi:diguanylate cyclase (GGDEF)-like protein
MPTDPVNSPRFKRSIRSVTDILLGLFVVLFVLIVGFSYRQLSDTEESYNNIATNVVPTLADNGIMHSQLTAVAFLVSSFAQANTLPEMRISYAQVNEKLTEIDRLVPSESPLASDLETIRTEFIELYYAINRKLALEATAQELTDTLSDIQQASFEQRDGNQLTNTEFLKLELDLLRLSNAKKLINVRQLERSIRQQLSSIKQNNSLNEQGQSYLAKLEEIALSSEGLIDTKSLKLREQARTAGQSNFLRRFVLDVAKNAEFNSYQFAEQQAEIAGEFATESSNRFTITLAVYGLSFSIGLILILYIKSRVVSRLVSLKRLVNSGSMDKIPSELSASTDEIGDLTRTITDQFNTIEEQKDKLKQLSFVDSLTNIANRRAFNERLEQVLNVSQRNVLSVSLFVIDVDCFKQYNDTYGHLKGDECLHTVAQTIDSTTRRGSDFVARYGGEEFVCILVGQTSEEATDFANQICEQIRALAIEHKDSEVTNIVTVSIGVHTELSLSRQSAERLLQCADTALYQAKTNGRDQVCQYITETDLMDKI